MRRLPKVLDRAAVLNWLFSVLGRLKYLDNFNRNKFLAQVWWRLDWITSWSWKLHILIDVLLIQWWFLIKKGGGGGDFPGGAVVKNPPASAGDTGLIPGLGRSHLLRSKLSPYTTTTEARVPQLLSLRCRTREPQLLKPVRLEPMLRNKRSHCSEKHTHRNEDPTQPKIK